MAFKKTPPQKEELGKLSTFEVSFSRLELAHIRDLFSVKLPPEMTTTLSEALAETQSRQLIEQKLWQKLVKVLVSADIPVDDNAPDFTLMPTGPVPVSVFQIEASDTEVYELLKRMGKSE